MKKTFIVLLVLFAIGGSYGENSVLYRFATDFLLVENDVHIQGRILATGNPASENIDGVHAAIVASPEPDDPYTYGVIATSNMVGVLTHSDEGTGLLGTSRDGDGVRGVAFNGTGTGVTAEGINGGIALEIIGKMIKEVDDQNMITLYDDQGNAVGTYFFSFD